MRPFAPKNTTVFCHGWATKVKFWKCRPSKINESNCIWVICSILFDECTHQGKRDIDLRRWRQYCTLPADIKIGKAICLNLLVCTWFPFVPKNATVYCHGNEQQTWSFECAYHSKSMNQTAVEKLVQFFPTNAHIKEKERSISGGDDNTVLCQQTLK